MTTLSQVELEELGYEDVLVWLDALREGWKEIDGESVAKGLKEFIWSYVPRSGYTKMKRPSLCAYSAHCEPVRTVAEMCSRALRDTPPWPDDEAFRLAILCLKVTPKRRRTPAIQSLIAAVDSGHSPPATIKSILGNVKRESRRRRFTPKIRRL